MSSRVTSRRWPCAVSQGTAVILSPTILFVYAKLRNTTTVPRDLPASESGRHDPRSGVMELMVSVPRDHQVLESESGALWPALWVSAAVVAMVAFSYWLSVV